MWRIFWSILLFMGFAVALAFLAPEIIQRARASLSSELLPELALTGHAYGVLEVLIAVLGFGGLILTLVEQGRFQRRMAHETHELLTLLALSNGISALLARLDINHRVGGTASRVDLDALDTYYKTIHEQLRRLNS
jgi:hypothetical protein